MTLRSFIEDVGSADRTIAVVSDDATGPIAEMLAETFADQPVAVGTDVPISLESDLDPEIADALERDGDTAVLLENGRPIAASPIRELYDSILAINSDLFVTGARGMGEIDLPNVLANLDEIRLRLRDYPLSHKEKLFLILVSRHIEQRAWAAGSGTIHSAFQRLSRMNDGIGTRDVYAELAATDVDTHVYGFDDDTTIDLDVSVHTGTDEVYRDGWFVVYEPDDRGEHGGETTAGPAALVCLETESRIWEGFWTDDADRVAAIETAIAQNL